MRTLAFALCVLYSSASFLSVMNPLNPAFADPYKMPSEIPESTADPFSLPGFSEMLNPFEGIESQVLMTSIDGEIKSEIAEFSSVANQLEEDLSSLENQASSFLYSVDDMFVSAMSHLSSEFDKFVSNLTQAIESDLDQIESDMAAMTNCSLTIYNNSKIFNQINAIENNLIEIIQLWNPLRAEVYRIGGACGFNVSSYTWLTNPNYTMPQSVLNDFQCGQDVADLVEDIIYIVSMADGDIIEGVVHLIRVIHDGEDAYYSCQKVLNQYENNNSTQTVAT